MRELYFLAEDDVDLSSKIWYYALSLEFILDAGIVLESYRMSYNYYMNVGKKRRFLSMLEYMKDDLWDLSYMGN